MTTALAEAGYIKAGKLEVAGFRHGKQDRMVEGLNVKGLSPVQLAMVQDCWPQQALYFFPLPQGQSSLRPGFFSAMIGCCPYSCKEMVCFLS